MRSLTYVSSARTLWSEAELDELLTAARAWNEPRGLTGMLLYSGGNFIQSIEGADEMIAEGFHRISVDSRHRGLLVMLDEQIDRRAFSEWTMGFRRISPGALGLNGHTDFLRNPAAAGTADAASAQMILLESFRAVSR